MRGFFELIFGRWFPEWFDLGLRDEQNLSEEDKEYIRSFTFGPYLTFWYCIFRNCGHFFLLELGIAVGGILSILLLAWLFGFSHLLLITLILLVLLEIFDLCLLIFFMTIARRLSWNRCSWTNIESFKKSEKSWNIAVLVVFILNIVFRFWRISR